MSGITHQLTFIYILNFFQIMEENAMINLFKDEFLEYKKNVRR